jgi:homoserine kinase
MSSERVTVRVPATTANMGSGFDCLGMALDIYNEVTVERGDKFSLAIQGEGTKVLSRGKDNKVRQGITAIYREIGQPVPELSIRCKNEIPLVRGLVSSAAERTVIL